MTHATSLTDFLPEVRPVVDWPANVDHVSASALKTFAACPLSEQYRRRYLCGEKIPPGAAAVWGTADHRAAAFNYEQKIASHHDLPLEDVEQRFVAAVDEAVDEWGGVSELDWSGKFDGEPVKGTGARKQAIGTVKDRGVKLAGAYHKKAAPLVQPDVVEDRFTIQVPGVPVPMTGFIDLIGSPARSALSDVMADAFGLEPPAADAIGRRIIDRKTVPRKTAKPEQDWLFQSAIYQLAVWLPHEWHISVKTKDPYVIEPGTEPALIVKASTTRKRWVEKMVHGVIAELGWCYVTYGADEPWPASRALVHQWRCSYCGYELTCPWRKG